MMAYKKRIIESQSVSEDKKDRGFFFPTILVIRNKKQFPDKNFHIQTGEHTVSQ